MSRTHFAVCNGMSTNILTLSIIVLALWIATPTVSAQAPGTQTFKSPNGYSLTYPSNWQLASSSQQDNVRQAARDFANQAGMAVCATDWRWSSGSLVCLE